jgi:L-lysine 6-transaminase
MEPQEVHATLARHQLADGYPLVLDLDKSHGSWLHDARTGQEYLDCFTCFASWPVGYNHPALANPEFTEELKRAALTKPSNSDLYTRELAAFVEAFATRVTPAGFSHHFWVSGGALAVENALKIAFDWKARKLGRRYGESVNDISILHFKEAFHGRTGYTMSLTNTDPAKVELFPKFDWPRVHNPKIEFGPNGEIQNDVAASEARAVAEIEAAFQKRGNTIAAIILEPMQGEGGDNHFRKEFFAELRRIANEKDALLILDEVQTGFFGSGKPWMWQHFDVRPDVVAFGKKAQVCGVYAGPRVDEVPDNVFKVPSRINSTWGGNLTDMVRSRRFIEIIENERLAESVTRMGDELVRSLRELARQHGVIFNVRGRGSLVAFTLESKDARQAMLKQLFERKLLALPSGQTSIRFRLPLNISSEEVSAVLERVADCLPSRV